MHILGSWLPNFPLASAPLHRAPSGPLGRIGASGLRQAFLKRKIVTNMMARLYLPKRSVNPEEIVMSHRLFSTIVCLSTLLLSIGSANGQTYKNIALNPKDVRAPGHGFPHASSNSEYPCIYPQDTAGGNQCAPDTTFLALSAINGDTNNASHGTLAYASWGPQLTVPGLWWKVDFGHNVTVDKVKIWVRADWRERRLTTATGKKPLWSFRTGRATPFP